MASQPNALASTRGGDRLGRALRGEADDRDRDRQEREHGEQDVDHGERLPARAAERRVTWRRAGHGRRCREAVVPGQEQRDEQQEAAEARRSARPCATGLRPRRLERVAHQHGDRHRADAAGHGRDQPGALAGGFELDVAGELAVEAVHADVDDHGALLDPVALDQRAATPTAATSTSARRQTSARSRVREWRVVTVALACSSSAEIGLPTRSERPTTTASAPSSGDVVAAQQLHAAERRARPQPRAGS